MILYLFLIPYDKNRKSFLKGARMRDSCGNSLFVFFCKITNENLRESVPFFTRMTKRRNKKHEKAIGTDSPTPNNLPFHRTKLPTRPRGSLLGGMPHFELLNINDEL